MNFWNRNKISKNTRKEYASLLIKLVELNEDKQWLDYFYKLKLGKDLPGGGMGSLNDWSPYYANYQEYAWFNLLYGITHKLLTEKKEPEFIINDFSIRQRKRVDILKCSNCNQKFQHPRIFEDQIATLYYFKNYEKYIDQQRLLDLANPEFSYKNNEAVEIRESLEAEYKKNDILLFDFQKSNKICPNCNTSMEVGYLTYEIIEKANGLQLI